VTKYPKNNSLREESFILANSFGEFSPWSAGSIAFRPMMRQKILEKGYGRGKFLTRKQR
jgi:hypothetical protein